MKYQEFPFHIGSVMSRPLALAQFNGKLLEGALGQLLVEKPTEVARFTKSDPSNPRAFHWTSSTSLIPQHRITISPAPPVAKRFIASPRIQESCPAGRTELVFQSS